MTEWGRQWGKLVDLMRDEAIEIQNVGGEGYYLVSPTKLADRLLNNGVRIQEWIPVEDRLPENDDNVLVWYQYFRYGDHNRLFRTIGISHMFQGDWSGFVNGTSGWSKLKILAWMPMPEALKEKE